MSQHYYCVWFLSFILLLVFPNNFESIFQLTILCSNPRFKKSYCISVTFNNFAESKREQSLAFCLSIIMCMNFIFYLVVGFSKQFHLAYGFEANKMRSSKKKMHLSSSTAQRVRASLKTYIKRRACSINYSKYTIRLSDEKIQKTTRQSRESLYVHLFFA